MKQLFPFYACRKAWSLVYQDKQPSCPDRIWVVMGREGIETHIGTSEEYLDKDVKKKIKNRGIKFKIKY